MQSAFGIVVVIVIVAAVLVAVAFLLSGRVWDEYGKGGLTMERSPARGGAAGSRPAGDRERDEEIRQMLEARNARRARRGEAEVDIEAELARLTRRPAIDAGLREEIRELVVARNHRRARRGEPPLDVEAEVAREIEKLGG